MKKRKYRLYLTAEERRYIFNAPLVCRNKLPTQEYTDLVDEVMIKLQKWACNAFKRKIEGQGTNIAPQSSGLENGLKSGFFDL